MPKNGLAVEVLLYSLPLSLSSGLSQVLVGWSIMVLITIPHFMSPTPIYTAINAGIRPNLAGMASEAPCHGCRLEARGSDIFCMKAFGPISTRSTDQIVSLTSPL